MFLLKIKVKDKEMLRFYLRTLQEVADYIKETCNAKSLEEILAKQKEYNIRFYLSYKKEG